eukprot:TRINITY_DN6817_c0_g1_i1.p1 TRINITY_DN6817_c0_g1~~TRINITY_DN6817_c0_g1_i1.p1  ORF type:complete len:327 (+),score=68.66 TRINITY_DN6817_c0_g1_i1:1-981(+)
MVYPKEEHTMKVAVIGQSAFGAAVYQQLKEDGHEIVGVFSIPDTNGREDLLIQAAKQDDVPYFKINRWCTRKKSKTLGRKVVLRSVMDKYAPLKAEVNVLAFVTKFIPMEIIDAPEHGSLIYHPSILPEHRGASAINWSIMNGDKIGGFTIFYGDDGLDTGDILLCKEVEIDINDTLSSLYKRFLFPEGVKGFSECLRMIQDGTAERIVQPEEGASYDPLWQDKALCEINWDNDGLTLHNFIRGNDKVPGAWTNIKGVQVTLYGSQYIGEDEFEPVGQTIVVDDCERTGVLTEEGIVFSGTDGSKFMVTLLRVGRDFFQPNEYFNQ